jgi:chemotaxis signal transduction protein
VKLAQGILCGSWALAFPFDWARQIVDSFELSPIPKAPPWLLGATNIEGGILPVIDLEAYFTGAAATANSRQRLLIGGLISGRDAEDRGDAVALAFDGLPQQISYEPRTLTYRNALPERLREVCMAIANNAAGQEYLEIDAARLLESLGAALDAE